MRLNQKGPKLAAFPTLEEIQSLKDAISAAPPSTTITAASSSRAAIGKAPGDLRPNFPPVFERVWVFNLASCGLFFHSHFHCEFAGGDIAQRRVRSVPVVILLPCSDGGAGLGERREQRLIQALVTEAAVDGEDGPAPNRLVV